MRIADLYVDDNTLSVNILEDRMELRVRDGARLWTWDVEKPTAVKMAKDILNVYERKK